MNSFNFAAKGIEREVERQIAIYEAGGTVEQETLHFDPGNESSPPLRSKEEAEDYRYFPEPDLVPVHPPADLVERLRGRIGELPGARIARIAETLSFYDADVLVTGGLDRLWAAAVDAGAEPKEAANVLANAFVATGVDPARVDPGELAKLVAARAEVPRAAFDEALARSGDEGFSADPYLARKAVADVTELDPVIDRVLAANAGQVAAYRGGKEGLLGFFVGQVMKETGGTADPRVVSERLREKLAA
jgi:aspartyl-tRNA(Asn)/glutamyl-tRNA(Gln) amidotransferase subunit B